MKRKIVTLCGSTRFYRAFQEANYRETMAGHIVLTVGFYPHAAPEAHGEERGCTPDEKAALDVLHFDKIAMSDEILVLNVDGYVGDSTKNEIAYAVLTDTPIRWLEPERGGDAWLSEHAHDLGARVVAHLKGRRV